MFYDSELFFVEQLLKRQHIPVSVININKATFDDFDSTGILCTFGIDGTKNKFSDYFPSLEPNKIYRIKNFFFCTYIYLQLPDAPIGDILFIGPYTNTNITRQMILEKGESLGLTPGSIKQLELCISQVTPVNSEASLHSLIDTLGEFMWGEDNYSLLDIERDETSDHRIFYLKNENNPENTAMQMKIMEQRYNYENQMMDAVSHGKTAMAELLLPNFSQLSFEKRLSDQLRNIKNYCIIMNTLLRKAAENGGVHPIYIDSISSEYAKKIELLPNINVANKFMTDMFKDYCNLVRRKSTRHFSPIVERAIAFVDTDLTADLTLKHIAKINGVSESYFSTLFKKETGQTYISYLTNKRISLAKKLLKTTNLQIQSVAQHCGIYDVHYFSKMFREKTGKTPKQYRESAI